MRQTVPAASIRYLTAFVCALCTSGDHDPGDHNRKHGQGTLAALLKTSRAPPVTPTDFNGLLSERVFGYDSDRAVCEGLYSGVASALFPSLEKLDFTQLSWTLNDWRRFGSTILMCGSLKYLYINEMNLDGQCAAAMFGALGDGAAAKLEHFQLEKNAIGSEGMLAFCAAVGRGAFPMLYHLNLMSNRVGDECCRALATIFQDGRLPKLGNLDLRVCDITMAGATALVEVIDSGKVPALAEESSLDLGNNAMSFEELNGLKKNDGGERRRFLC